MLYEVASRSTGGAVSVKVFISYSQKNENIPQLRWLLRDLEGLDVELWVDTKLAGGTIWWKEILQQIRGCDAFVFVLTKESLQSRPCEAELAWAVINHRQLLPVKVTDVPEWLVPESLASAQIIDYTTRDGTSAAAVACVLGLTRAVDRLAREPLEAAPEPAPEPPEIPFSPWQTLQPYLAAEDLSLPKQEEFLLHVKLCRAEVDSDLMTLVEILTQFRRRPDIAYSVALDVEHLVGELSRSPEQDRPRRPVPDEDIRAGGTAGGQAAEKATAGTPPSAPKRTRAKTHPAGRRPAEKAVAVTPLSAPKEPRAKIARFVAPGIRVNELADNLVAWYRSLNMEAQLRQDGPRTIVQCRSHGLSRIVGAGTALTVVLWTEGHELVAELGGSKWMDKAAAAGVGLVIGWPALIPAGVGGVKQAWLPERTVRHIEKAIPAVL